MTMLEIDAGMLSSRSAGVTGVLAIWQWTHSIGSAALNGRLPVNIWYKVTPKA